MLDHLQRGHLSEACQLVHQWGQEDWLYCLENMFFIALSTEVHLLKSAWFCQNHLVLSACSLAGSSAVINSARCSCRPPPRFNAMDTTFPLINQLNLIRDNQFSPPPILGSIGAGKSARTPSTPIAGPAILSCSLGRINSGFFPWENSYNLLKRYY